MYAYYAHSFVFNETMYKMATFSLAKVENHETKKGVATISESNLTVPLLHTLWTIDEGRYYKEFLHLHENLTVVESML